MTCDEFFDAMQNSAIKAYITVYGQERWNALCKSDKDTVVHTLVMDFAKAVLECEHAMQEAERIDA